MQVLAPETNAFDRAVRPYVESLFPAFAQTVLNAKADPAIDERIEELAGKSNEGELTVEERAEYEAYVSANYFVAKLKRLAEKSLNGSAD